MLVKGAFASLQIQKATVVVTSLREVNHGSLILGWQDIFKCASIFRQCALDVKLLLLTE